MRTALPTRASFSARAFLLFLARFHFRLGNESSASRIDTKTRLARLVEFFLSDRSSKLDRFSSFHIILPFRILDFDIRPNIWLLKIRKIILLISFFLKYLKDIFRIYFEWWSFLLFWF